MTLTNTGREFDLILRTRDADLAGRLTVPAAARGLVLFAHGSGSSRCSQRNGSVAEVLQEAQLATLLFDLLTPEEAERDRVDQGLRFDIPLLSQRLIGAVDWARQRDDLADLPVGLFGASTGAAAAIHAAVARPQTVAAVVSRGGRPDLAMEVLAAVACPTLLIVGGLDFDVLRLNRQAASRLRSHHALLVIPEASHLFEEPGSLRHAADLARDWFMQHLCPAKA
ncbi:MAG: dienelactone hydrolase family protein [Cyanobacteria bacterium]|nr:dienelactone hydrolase family protein [Cyanobacteriota bacterium]